MAYKVFLDANILLDFTLKRNDYEQSKKIMSFAVDGQIEGFITPSIVHILAYWMSKAYGTIKTKELLIVLLSSVTVINIPHNIVLNALQSSIEDVEDALQYYSALHHGLNCLITRDKLFQKESTLSLPIYSPEQFLSGFKFPS